MLRSFFRYRILWIGLFLLFALAMGGYFAVNNWLMPTYTRHGVTVTVPDTRDMTYTEAAQQLRTHNLQAERVVSQFDPDKPRNVVLDQNPAPKANVKPGRRVYLRVNSGAVPKVKVPDLVHLSVRQAKTVITDRNLRIGSVREDTIPSPYKNTITRQRPAPGDSVQEQTTVDLWVSPGMGKRQIEVPDVSGLPLTQADSVLLQNNLRMVILSDTSQIQQPPPYHVRRQDPQPGDSVRAGSEVRIVTSPAPQPQTVRF